MTLKTPGVFIVEKNAFPNSVVEVASAVPAFVGPTQYALNHGKPLRMKPWRISSMAEYEAYFGGAPGPVFSLQVADAGAKARQPDRVAAPGQQTAISWGDQTLLLSRAAGKAGGRFLMHQALRHFFQNGGGACYIVSVGDYSAEIAVGDEQTGLLGGIACLRNEQEPTLVVVPDAVMLPRADCVTVQAAMVAHCGRDMRNRFAILDVWGGDTRRDAEQGSCIDAFREDIGDHFLGFAAAYYPWLHTSLVQEDELHFDILDSTSRKLLGGLIATDLAQTNSKASATAQALLAELNQSDAAAYTQLVTDIVKSSRTDEAKAEAIRSLADPDHLSRALAEQRQLLHRSLRNLSPLYAQLMGDARALLNLMPPAAAIAGLYTMVDNSRGVWTAPANISVAGAIAPAVQVSDTDQEDLNVTTNGKSINALRHFIGEGVLVWGARTLDGNSLDWRYINVRRTMIMLEESCRLAAKSMVFEANDSNTWVTVRSMITSFLTGLWKRGGLAGATPADAFSVQVGLGETMTAEDILEGILRVTILVAISRPAEFMEISFQQQMQKS